MVERPLNRAKAALGTLAMPHMKLKRALVDCGADSEQVRPCYSQTLRKQVHLQCNPESMRRRNFPHCVDSR